MTKRYWETSDFWKDSGEKAVTSFIQGAFGLLIVDGLTGPTIDMANLKTCALTGLTMAIISLAKSFVGSRVAPNSTTPTSFL